MPAPLSSILGGVWTALVTPFRNDRIDLAALAGLVESQIAAGIDGLVPVGTTGESATLSVEEHLAVIAETVRIAAGRVPVFAGTGSNNTAEALELTRAAEKRGASGFLLVTPYYNRPTAAGLFAHFAALAEATPKPIILYSVPSRTGVELALETAQRLAENFPQIVAIKEAGGTIDRFSQLRHGLPERVAILSGDDAMTLPALAVGATGVISVASNLIPGPVGEMVRAFRTGRPSEAETWHRRYYPLFRDLFIESNPVPVKAALARAGLMSAEVRLPLVPLQPASAERLFATLAALGL